VDIPSGNTKATASRVIAHLLTSNLLSKASAPQLLRVLGISTTALGSNDAQTPLSQHEELLALTGNVPEFRDDNYATFVRQSRLAARELGISPKEPVILVNGRVRIFIHSLRLSDMLWFESSSAQLAMEISSPQISKPWKSTSCKRELNR
jgi:hypothetical protein